MKTRLSDNRDLPETLLMPFGDPQPQHVYAFNSTRSQYLTAESINPYFGGYRVVDPDSRKVEVRGIWWCPSAIPRTESALQDEVA